jgi:threonine synthase
VIRYQSTRNPAGPTVSFAEALLQGLASDGGLFIPTTLPTIPLTPLKRAQSLAELGSMVMQAWLKGDFPPDQLAGMIHQALDFPTPVVQLSDNLWVLELFHGPTLSFKDYGARTMARLMAHVLKARGEQRIILVATSGDTGSAVADGFAGMENIRVKLLYPKGKVSPVQERQLISARPGVQAFAVAGTFDDCQRIVKAAFVDPQLAHLPLSSANSINIGRLLPQSLYYLWAAVRSNLDAPIFCVPSGNLGNLTAGVLASLTTLGVPRFIAAHNANHFFPDFLAAKTPAYAFHPTLATLSNAMDVGAPSNFERLYTMVETSRLRAWLWGTSVDDAATLQRIRTTHEAYGYLACPHTAVGLEGVMRYRAQTGDNRPVITLACAHPAKFPETVARALDSAPPVEPKLAALWRSEVNVIDIAPDLAELKPYLSV